MINLVAEVRQRAESLSPRERNILAMAAQGLADKEIAAKMGISMGTVRTYWQRMRDKLNAHSRSEILSLCMQERHHHSVTELETFRDRLLAAFHGTMVGIALLNQEDVILEANAAFARRLGAQPSEVVGCKFRRLRAVLGAAGKGDGGPALHGREIKWAAGALEACRHPVSLGNEPCWVVTLMPDGAGA